MNTRNLLCSSDSPATSSVVPLGRPVALLVPPGAAEEEEEEERGKSCTVLRGFGLDSLLELAAEAIGFILPSATPSSVPRSNEPEEGRGYTPVAARRASYATSCSSVTVPWVRATAALKSGEAAN